MRIAMSATGDSCNYHNNCLILPVDNSMKLPTSFFYYDKICKMNLFALSLVRTSYT